MKKFLLLTLIAAMLSNSLVCMDNNDKESLNDNELPIFSGMEFSGLRKDGRITVPDRMVVVDKRFNRCFGVSAVAAALVTAKSLYEGDVFWSMTSVGSLSMFTYAFMKKEVHIELHEGQERLATITYTEDLEGTIARLKKQIDAWNKLRNENPAAAQELKNKMREGFQESLKQKKEQKKAPLDEDASEQSQN